MAENQENLMDKIISLAKRRGFVFPGSDIYGGLANSWDFGPLGAQLKKNLKDHWWRFFVTSRRDMVGLDASILMNSKVWEASGHIENFVDPLVECKKCHHRFRADQIDITKGCPDCKGELTQPRAFNGLMKTFLGPVEDDSAKTFLRPETAQAMFVDFPLILGVTRKKLPFGVAQIGKSFRNEITPGNFIFRTREFEQMEIEYFFHPKDDWNERFEAWKALMEGWMDAVGIDMRKVHAVEIPDGERAHYSKRTVDFEFEYPFGQKELFGLAYRGDYDLTQHGKASGQAVEYFDEETKEKIVPHVIEPSFGVERALLALLLSCYDEEISKEADGTEEVRVVMRFPKAIAPVQIAILPLSKKVELQGISEKIYTTLSQNFTTEYDETQSIGKRYRRQDEIGTPYCVTVDFETLNDQAVTVRDRDTMEQKRVKIDELQTHIANLLYA